MLRFSRYAEQKFDLLNNHKVFVTREQVLEAARMPERTEQRGNHLFAHSSDITVVLKKIGGHDTVITFYPRKTNAK